MDTANVTELRIAPRERLRDRLVARLRSRHLDTALANGVPPEASAALALRARRLTDASERRRLAEAIRRLDQPGSHYLRVGPLRGRVAAASDHLDQLAHELAEPGPVSARGVAQARILLGDGTGPLYNPRNDASVRHGAAAAAASLLLPA
jgi:hypothetical protein